MSTLKANSQDSWEPIGRNKSRSNLDKTIRGAPVLWKMDSYLALLTTVCYTVRVEFSRGWISNTPNMDFVPSLAQRVKLLATVALKICQVPDDTGDTMVLWHVWRSMSTYPEDPELLHNTSQSRKLMCECHFSI